MDDVGDCICRTTRLCVFAIVVAFGAGCVSITRTLPPNHGLSKSTALQTIRNGMGSIRDDARVSHHDQAGDTTFTYVNLDLIQKGYGVDRFAVTSNTRAYTEIRKVTTEVALFEFLIPVFNPFGKGVYLEFTDGTRQLATRPLTLWDVFPFWIANPAGPWKGANRLADSFLFMKELNSPQDVASGEE